MKQTLKFLLLAVAILLALMLALAAYVAATLNPNDYKPQLVKWVQQETGRTLLIPGVIKLTFFPNIGADLGRLSLSERGSDEVFVAATHVRISVALLPLLSRQVVIDRVVVDGLALRLHRDRSGRFNFDDLISKDKGAANTRPAPPAPSEVPSSLPRLDIGGIALTRSSLDFRDDAQQRHVRISNLDLTTGPIASGRKSQLDFRADLAAEQPALALRLTLQTGFRPDFAQTRVQLEELAASVSGSAAGRSDVKFRLDVPELTATARSVQAPMLALELSAPQPGAGPLSLKVKGQASADLAAEAVQLALDGQFDATTLSLQAGVKHFAQPAVDMDLSLGELDVDRYLPPKTTPAPSSPAAAATPEAAIDLAPMNALDARGTLKIAALKVMGLRATNVRMQLTAQRGRADLKPLTATLYGGGVNGTLSATAGPQQALAAKLDLRAIQIGPLLRDMLNQQPIDGRGNVAINVNTTGHTVSQLKRELNGTAGLQLQDGAINGINIAAALRSAKSALGGGARQGVSAPQEKTDFTEFSASFKIRQGIAHNDDLSAKTPLLRLGGTGDVYLAEDRLDYTVKATVVPTLQGQGGPGLEELAGLTVPVRLSGPYTALGWKIDYGGLAAGRAATKLDQRKGQVQEDVQKKLDAEKARAQERLKDLLRR